jgi:glyoxylase-like metal-dependent hydrolase (beta-lactamase superfamily II)/rhodanese-related sulfurtransferase
MYFKQILDEENGCASYLIASRESREAAIVDPSADQAQYDALLAARGFRLRYVIDTHVHADHISLARALAAAHGAELCLHEAAAVNYPYRALHDGEELPLGELRLRVWHTPGHRPELVSILVIDPARSAEPAMVLTGDSLLAGDVGRPDFGGGDAAQQFASIARLLQLPDGVAVFPGHFEGPCGKSMSGQPSTTMGYERLSNPMLRLEREAFVEALNSGVPPRPLNMAAIEATNRGRANAGWAMLVTAPEVPQVEIDALATRGADAVVLDVREAEEYLAGHVPGAINMPQAELALRLAELPPEGDLYVICRSGSRSQRATQFLHTRGLRHASNVRGGTEAWRAGGKPLAYGAAPYSDAPTSSPTPSPTSTGSPQHDTPKGDPAPAGE